MLERYANAAVLVVDDTEANARLLHKVLTKSGLTRVELVTDSRQAMARYDALQPDLVLLDLHMPGMDGYSILTQLRDRVGANYLPVVVLTADTTREAVHRALRLGARDFLTKPIDTLELLLRVRGMLETQELYDRLRHQNVVLQTELAGYQRDEHAELQARQARRLLVQRVLDEDLLAMAFQPVVDVRSHHVVGYEALARFHVEPAQGPQRWFADASDVGLGIELELAAIERGLRMQQSLPAGAFVAVNVSPPTALSGAFSRLLQGAVSSQLVIELTEHVLVEDFDAIADALAPIRAQGVRLAVDDTGAGYAGFRHLLGLNPDIIKLDVCLTRGIDSDPARRALAAALVRFSEDTDTKLIAEGVETADELSALVDLGIGWAQGYHLGRPGPMAASPPLAASLPGQVPAPARLLTARL